MMGGVDIEIIEDDGDDYNKNIELIEPTEPIEKDLNNTFTIQDKLASIIVGFLKGTKKFIKEYEEQTLLFDESEQNDRNEYINKVKSNLKYFDNDFKTIINDLVNTIHSIFNEKVIKELFEKYNLKLLEHDNTIKLRGGAGRFGDISNFIHDVYTPGTSGRNIKGISGLQYNENAESDVYAISVEVSRNVLDMLFDWILIQLMQNVVLEPKELSFCVFLPIALLLLMIRIIVSPSLTRTPPSNVKDIAGLASRFMPLFEPLTKAYQEIKDTPKMTQNFIGKTGKTTTDTSLSQVPVDLPIVSPSIFPAAFQGNVGRIGKTTTDTSLSQLPEGIFPSQSFIETFIENPFQQEIANNLQICLNTSKNTEQNIFRALTSVIDSKPAQIARHIISFLPIDICYRVASSEWAGWRNPDNLIMQRTVNLNLLERIRIRMRESPPRLTLYYRQQIINIQQQIASLDIQIDQARYNRGIASRFLRVVSDIVVSTSNMAVYPMLNDNDE